MEHDVFLKGMWVVGFSLAFFVFTLIRDGRKEQHPRLLFRASLVPLSVILTAPFVWAWVHDDSGFLFLPKLVVGTCVMTTIVLLMLFAASDAGRRRPVSESEPSDIRTVRLPKFMAKDGDQVRSVSLARQVSSPVRAVRNSGAMFGIIFVLIIQGNFITAMLISDYVNVASLPVEVVWSSLTNGTLVQSGQSIAVMSDGGVTALYHCDDYSASFGSSDRFSSHGIRALAARMCGLAAIPDAPEIATSY